MSGKERNRFGAILAGCALYSGVYIYRTSFLLDGQRFFCLFDDAMISMRYARHLASGHGLVWNPGSAPVEGITNPLWTVIMAVIHFLPIPERWMSLPIQLTGALFLLLAVVKTRDVADGLGGQGNLVALIACALTAFYYPLLTWSLQGMEVSAFENRNLVVQALHIKRFTYEGATVAVVWAGAIPYFCERHCIDILGKNDPVIGRGDARLFEGRNILNGFTPGHQKWDYGYSVGTLKPDVVAQLWRPTEEVYRILSEDYWRVEIGKAPYYLRKGSEQIRWENFNLSGVEEQRG